MVFINYRLKKNLQHKCCIFLCSKITATTQFLYKYQPELSTKCQGFRPNHRPVVNICHKGGGAKVQYGHDGFVGLADWLNSQHQFIIDNTYLGQKYNKQSQYPSTLSTQHFLNSWSRPIKPIKKVIHYHLLVVFRHVLHLDLEIGPKSKYNIKVALSDIGRAMDSLIVK